jgi:hypothetical protein
MALNGDSLARQIQAASDVIANLGDTDVGRRVAEAQVSNILALVPKCRLHLEDVAKAMAVIGVSSFSVDQQNRMILVVAALKVVGGEGPAPGKSQNFESFPAFMPTSMDSTIGTQTFGSKLMELLLVLGLRSPSEGTFQMMAIYMLVATEGLEKTLSFTAESRHGMLLTTKAWFRRIVKNMTAPTSIIGRLPHTTEDLRLAHPSLYTDLYQTDPPSQALARLLDPISLEQLRGTTRMRKPKQTMFVPQMGYGAQQCPFQMQQSAWPFYSPQQQLAIADHPSLTVGRPRRALLPSPPFGQHFEHSPQHHHPLALPAPPPVRAARTPPQAPMPEQFHSLMSRAASSESLTSSSLIATEDSLARPEHSQIVASAVRSSLSQADITRKVEEAMAAKAKNASCKSAAKRRRKKAVSREAGGAVEKEHGDDDGSDAAAEDETDVPPVVVAERKRLTSKTKDPLRGGGAACDGVACGRSVDDEELAPPRKRPAAHGAPANYIANEASRSRFRVRIPGTASKSFPYAAGSEDIARKAAIAHISMECSRLGF